MGHLCNSPRYTYSAVTFLDLSATGKATMFSINSSSILVPVLLVGVIVSASNVCALTAHAQTTTVKEVLAPTGKLRVGVYPGSPTSMVKAANTGEIHGIAFDLGRELARQLGVPFEPVTYLRVDEILKEMMAGQLDFTVTNATPVRAKDLDFSQTLLSIELGYLVPPNSAVRAIEDIDQATMRIGVTQGSTSQRTLPKLLKHASVVPASSLKEAAQMIRNKQLDAFATNKPILFEMSDGIPGARILDGRWGVEHVAVAIPRGRDTARDYIRRFVEEVQQSGLLARAISQSGLRGSIRAE
jgi:polar amino acid transport system substrate-binding protein